MESWGALGALGVCGTVALLLRPRMSSGTLRAAALHFAHYDFVRLHRTLGIAPAMAAGVTAHLWSLRDLLAWEEPYAGRACLD